MESGAVVVEINPAADPLALVPPTACGGRRVRCSRPSLTFSLPKLPIRTTRLRGDMDPDAAPAKSKRPSQRAQCHHHY